MKGRSDISLILGRLRPSKQLTSTQVSSLCAAMRGGTMQPINFSKPSRIGDSNDYVHNIGEHPKHRYLWRNDSNYLSVIIKRLHYVFFWSKQTVVIS